MAQGARTQCRWVWGTWVWHQGLLGDWLGHEVGRVGRQKWSPAEEEGQGQVLEQGGQVLEQGGQGQEQVLEQRGQVLKQGGQGQGQVQGQGGQGGLLADGWSTDDPCWCPPKNEHQLCQGLTH
jgi:hypothetical protein